MKKVRAAMAMFAALVLALLVIAPAGALVGPENANWLDVNSPGTYCGYSYASVDATNAAPGTAKIFAEGVTEQKANNPCAWSYGSAQSLPAGQIQVQASLRCRWNGGAESVVWNSPTVGNTAGTAFVHVFDKGYDGAGTTNRCQPNGLTLEERTVVTSTYNTQFGALVFTHTTHWVTR